MHLIINLPKERADTACETSPPRHHLHAYLADVYRLLPITDDCGTRVRHPTSTLNEAPARDSETFGGGGLRSSRILALRLWQSFLQLVQPAAQAGGFDAPRAEDGSGDSRGVAVVAEDVDVLAVQLA
jgi:hypothetical protein